MITFCTCQVITQCYVVLNPSCPLHNAELAKMVLFTPTVPPERVAEIMESFGPVTDWYMNDEEPGIKH